MNRIVRNVFLISGIIPGTILFALSVFGLFHFLTDVSYDRKTSLLIFSFVLGILGYLGLWRNLVLPKSKIALNSLLLTLGIIGWLLFIIFVGRKIAIRWILSFKEPLDSLLFIWPLIVSIVILIINLRLKNS